MSQNIERAQKILQWFESLGVTDICICPGGRNAPFVLALANHPHFKVVSAFDERSAGFFAFGRAYSQRAPAVVITTSGTAAAELLPSVIESCYSSAPLIVVTADRPQSLRGSGSPQVIDQYRLFGNYVETCVDIDWNTPWTPPVWSQKQPLHINISFDEPLIDGELKHLAPLVQRTKPLLPEFDLKKFKESFTQFASQSAVPLMVIGPLHMSEMSSVQKIAASWPGVIYAEAASGLREVALNNRLCAGEKFLSQLMKDNKLSGVLRVGGVPTLKLWRELESAKIPVVSLSARPYAGMARGELIYTDLCLISDVTFDIVVPVDILRDITKTDQSIGEKQKLLLKKYPKSEPALLRSLSEKIPALEKIYVGNSLPIREWDAFASLKHSHHLLVNRGANGIDGQIVSALGMCGTADNLSVIVGDLTALYDATALWFKEQVKELRVFVINNNGGRIFERLFSHPSFYNTHAVNFAAWAQMWNMEHVKLTTANNELHGPAIYEVVPDAAETQAFWSEHDQLFH